MKKTTQTILVLLLCVGLVVFIKTKNPSTHLTTFDGKPAIGQVNWDGTYTFFYLFRDAGDVYHQGNEICTLPSGEACKLH